MQKSKIKYKKSIKWIIEISIWFLIFIAVASIISILRANNKNTFNTYQIFMPDVDGIIVGSPVNMMGIQVGYVSQLNIIEDEVFVKFNLTKKGLVIPKGSVVTVEFSGLGGSKSLEIYPNANTDNREEYLIMHPPKRLHSSLGLLLEMFEKISNISYKCSSFVKKTEEIKVPDKLNEKDLKMRLEESDKWIDNATKNIEKIHKKQKEK